GRGPRPGADLCRAPVSRLWHDLRSPSDHGPTACVVQVAGISVQLGGTGTPDPITQSGIHQFIFIIRQADIERGLFVLHRYRNGIAFRRVDIQEKPQLAGQYRTETAQAQHVTVSPKNLMFATLQRLYAQYPVTGFVKT